MKVSAVIGHGKPSKEKFENPKLLNPADSNWIPWIKRHMTLAGIFTVAPDLPDPTNPIYEDWRDELDRYDVLDARKILIGYSVSAYVFLRMMSERPYEKVGKLVLPAPWLDPNGNYGGLGKFEIDPKTVERCIGGLTVLFDPGDDQQCLDSVEIIKKALPRAKYRELPGLGHFLVDGEHMTSPEFPELLEEVLS